VSRGYEPRYEIGLEVPKGLPYNRWRDLNPEDTLRFHALRLREVGMIKTAPLASSQSSGSGHFIPDTRYALRCPACRQTALSEKPRLATHKGERMKQELLQPAATITAALITSPPGGTHQTTVAEVAKLFASVYREMEDALKLIQTAELKPPHTP